MAKAVKNKSFKDWLYEDVAEEFGLTALTQHPLLTKTRKLLSRVDIRSNQLQSEAFH